MMLGILLLGIQLAGPAAAALAPPPEPATLLSTSSPILSRPSPPALPLEEDADEEEEEEAERPPVTYDVPIVVNESVEGWIEFFQTTYRERFTLWLNRSHRYLPLMRDIFRQAGLPEDLVFVALIESGFNPYAYSRSRATGPWQFMRGTAKKYGLKMDSWVDERRDPIKSTIAAARYLKDLYEMFNSWPLALASYNAGEGRVMRAMNRSGATDYWKLTASSRHLKRETRHYVPKYMAATIIAKNSEKYGFTLTEDDPIRHEEIAVNGPTDLGLVAKASGTTYATLKELNPELRRGTTPANVRTYMVRLPVGARVVYLENLAKIPEEKRLLWKRHKVRRGDTLHRIARRYQTTTVVLQDINRLDSEQRLTPGESLFIPLANEPLVLAEREPGERRQIVYTVRRGDTLTAIAKKHSVSVKDIRRWNRLGQDDLILSQQRLLLLLNADAL